MSKGHELIISIEVEPWMRKYLQKELGPQPWKITMDHYEGKVIFANLKGKSEKPKKWTRNPNMDVYQIIIPWYYLHQWGRVDMPQENIEHFIRYQQKKFTKHLILWVESRITLDEELRKKILIKDAIESFINRFEIDENDIAMDTLKKRVFRILHEKKKADIFIT
jgi:hypothetical protein